MSEIVVELFDKSHFGNTPSGRFAAVTDSKVKSSQLIFLVILLIGSFYLTTIRQGHYWGDDYAVYIQHAKNIVEGAEYDRFNYLYLPSYVGPGSYPPIFPLFLTPVYWLFGMNLMAMKVAVTLAFMFSLWLLTRILKDYLTVKQQAILLIMVGLNPYFWNLKDRIESEMLFCAAVNLSVYIVCKFYKSSVIGLAKLAYVLATGVSFYLAYGTRSAGLVLLPCLVLYDILRNRKLSWPSLYSIGVTTVTIALVIIQSFALRSDRSYVEQVQAGSQNFLYNWMVFIWQNIPRYTFSLTELWDNGYSKLFRISLAVLVSGLAVVGFLAQARRKATFLEVFVALYAISIVIVPMTGGIRYMLPIVPFYMFYALQGVMALPDNGGIRKCGIAAVTLAIIATYALNYSSQDYNEIPNGITKAEAADIFDYIKKQTTENDVIIFTKPRALALLTERKSSFYPRRESDGKIWGYFDKIRATHIVVGPNGEEPYDQAFLQGFVSRNMNLLRKEYVNADFVVYRITSLPNTETDTGRESGVKFNRN